MQAKHSTIDDPVQVVLSRLKSVKPTGENQWSALCPAHNDHSPSLAVSVGDDGRALVHCFSRNCSESAICAAIGLTVKDLFQSNGSPKPTKAPQPAKTESPVFPTIAAYVASLGDRCGGHWTYVDASGNPVLFIVRINKSDGKEFMQLHSVPGGVAFGGAKGKKLPLYRLPEIIDADTIYIFEGEKCADLAVTMLGYATATSWAGGANSVNKTDWSVLAGKVITIFPDADPPGMQAAQRIAGILTSLQPPASVKIVALPGLPEHGDIVDYVNVRECVDTEDIRRDIDELIAATPEFVPHRDTAKPESKPVHDDPVWQPFPLDVFTPKIQHIVTNAAESMQHEPTAIVPSDEIRKTRFAAVTLPWTELWAARKFVILHGPDIRYCKSLGWLTWDTVRWRLDATGEVVRKAKDTIRALYTLAGQIADKNDRLAYVQFVTGLEKRAKIDSILALASTEPEIAVRSDIFDADPWLLNCNNGTINLKTGKLQPHRQEDYCTKLAPVDYDPSAKCPRYDRFVDEIFSRSKDMISFSDRNFGRCLTGNVDEHTLDIWHGNGDNGKTKLAESIMEVLGDYALAAPRHLLVKKHHDGHATDRAVLCGARFVCISESADGDELDVELVKSLTGGDRVTARFICRDNFSFAPTWKICMFTNHRPLIRAQDFGTWRRIRLWPFGEKFSEPKDPLNPQPGEKDIRLADKLRAEYPGILLRWVRGCLEFQRIGTKPPVIVTEATAEYKEDSDVVGQFVVECCDLGEALSVTGGMIFSVYRYWCKVNGLTALGNRRFPEQLKRTPGVDYVRGRHATYTGIAVTDDFVAEYETDRDKYKPKSMTY